MIFDNYFCGVLGVAGPWRLGHLVDLVEMCRMMVLDRDFVDSGTSSGRFLCGWGTGNLTTLEKNP